MNQVNFNQIGRGKTLLQILILLIPFYFLRFQIGPVPTTLLELSIYLIFLVFLFTGNLKLENKTKQIIPAAVFVILVLIGALVDPDKMRGLGLWKGYFFDGFLVYLLFLSVDDTKDLLETVFYSGVLTSILALILFFSGVKSADGRLLDLDRLSPNYLAMFLTPILTLGIFQSIKNRSFLTYVGEAVIFSALALTSSRGALIAILGVVIMLIYYLLRKSAPKWSTAGLIIMLLIFFVGGYSVFRPDFSDHARKATSSNIRYYIWTTGLEMVRERPILGVGLGNFQDYFNAKTKNMVNYPEFITPEALTAHNLYLHLYLTGGLAALLGFIYLLISSKFYLFKSPAISLAIYAILFYSLVDTPLYRNDLATVFWILLSLNCLINFKNA